MIALITSVISTEAPVFAFVRKHGGGVEKSGCEYSKSLPLRTTPLTYYRGPGFSIFFSPRHCAGSFYFVPMSGKG